MDWDECYSEPGFAHGIALNEFLVSVVGRIPKGKILTLAEGEGKNAVYLASLGYEVTGVDGSIVVCIKPPRWQQSVVSLLRQSMQIWAGSR